MGDSILPSVTPIIFDELKIIVRRYQESVQALGICGLGCAHTWEFLRELGMQPAELTYEDATSNLTYEHTTLARDGCKPGKASGLAAGLLSGVVMSSLSLRSPVVFCIALSSITAW